MGRWRGVVGVSLSGDASHQKVLEEWKNEKGYVARHETHENPRSLLWLVPSDTFKKASYKTPLRLKLLLFT